MDFLSKLTKKAKETYEGASKKTGELAKEAKLRMKMNENKAEINDLYQEIGKKVYEKHVLSEEINIKVDLEEECTKIDILSAEIETCLNQIRELKDKKQCPNCYNEIELDSKFCNHCGAKQEMNEEREVGVFSEENDNRQTEGEELENMQNNDNIEPANKENLEEPKNTFNGLQSENNPEEKAAEVQNENNSVEDSAEIKNKDNDENTNS